MATLAHRLLKLLFFIALSMIIGRIIHPAAIAGDDNVIRLAKALYGQANAENIYDAQFYIDFPVIMVLTVIAYIAGIKAFRHVKKPSCGINNSRNG